MSGTDLSTETSLDFLETIGFTHRFLTLHGTPDHAPILQKELQSLFRTFCLDRNYSVLPLLLELGWACLKHDTAGHLQALLIFTNSLNSTDIPSEFDESLLCQFILELSCPDPEKNPDIKTHCQQMACLMVVLNHYFQTYYQPERILIEAKIALLNPADPLGQALIQQFRKNLIPTQFLRNLLLIPKIYDQDSFPLDLEPYIFWLNLYELLSNDFVFSETPQANPLDYFPKQDLLATRGRGLSELFGFFMRDPRLCREAIHMKFIGNQWEMLLLYLAYAPTSSQPIVDRIQHSEFSSEIIKSSGFQALIALLHIQIKSQSTPGASLNFHPTIARIAEDLLKPERSLFKTFKTVCETKKLSTTGRHGDFLALIKLFHDAENLLDHIKALAGDLCPKEAKGERYEILSNYLQAFTSDPRTPLMPEEIKFIFQTLTILFTYGFPENLLNFYIFDSSNRASSWLITTPPTSKTIKNEKSFQNYLYPRTDSLTATDIPIPKLENLLARLKPSGPRYYYIPEQVAFIPLGPLTFASNIFIKNPDRLLIALTILLGIRTENFALLDWVLSSTNIPKEDKDWALTLMAEPKLEIPNPFNLVSFLNSKAGSSDFSIPGVLIEKFRRVTPPLEPSGFLESLKTLVLRKTTALYNYLEQASDFDLNTPELAYEKIAFVLKLLESRSEWFELILKEALVVERWNLALIMIRLKPELLNAAFTNTLITVLNSPPDDTRTPKKTLKNSPPNLIALLFEINKQAPSLIELMNPRWFTRTDLLLKSLKTKEGLKLLQETFKICPPPSRRHHEDYFALSDALQKAKDPLEALDRLIQSFRTLPMKKEGARETAILAYFSEIGIPEKFKTSFRPIFSIVFSATKHCLIHQNAVSFPSRPKESLLDWRPAEEAEAAAMALPS